MTNSEAKPKGARLGEVELVRDCLICDSRVILLARKNSRKPMPPKDAVLRPICEGCRKKYLDEQGGVMLYSDAGGVAILKEPAFKGMFPKVEIPQGRICRTDEEVIQIIINAHKEAPEVA